MPRVVCSSRSMALLNKVLLESAPNFPSASLSQGLILYLRILEAQFAPLVGIKIMTDGP